MIFGFSRKYPAPDSILEVDTAVLAAYGGAEVGKDRLHLKVNCIHLIASKSEQGSALVLQQGRVVSLGRIMPRPSQQCTDWSTGWQIGMRKKES